MRAAVTGAAGFIGSTLADHLLELGHEVIGLDSLVRGDLSHVAPQVKFWRSDIRDRDIRNLLKGADWVFHTAAVSTTPWAVRDPLECNSINVTGTLNLLQAARAAGVRRFIFSSSNIVYAAPTAYKVSKLAAEGYCEAYAHLYGLSTICLRYSNVFGSLRQNEENCIASMRAAALRDGEIQVTGDGGQTRDFSDVRDICRANVLAAQSDVTGHVDICTGTQRSMNEVAAWFGVPVRHVPERQGDVKHIYQNPAPAKRSLGYQAQVPFEESMAAYALPALESR